MLADGFTAHNIVLPDGTQTKSDSRVLADTEIARAAVRMAKALCPPTGEPHPRVADLGCLEGGYAVEFARAGYDVVGIEARSDSIARCNYVRRELGIQNLAFVQDDVRNLEEYGQFDIVFCSGLLYHLDTPVEFLRTLGRTTRKLLLLHTHYAEDQRNSDHLDARVKVLRMLARAARKLSVLQTHYAEERPNPDHLDARSRFARTLGRTARKLLLLPTDYAVDQHPLSDIAEHEGLLGRWYLEAPKGGWASREQMEASLWASWQNTASFWPLKRHLLKAMQSAGFPIVCEQFDALEDIVEDPYIEQHSRSMFAGIKL